MDKPCKKCIFKNRSSYHAPCTLCHQWGKWNNFKPRFSLEFTCKTCGQHVLECIMDNGYSSIVTHIDVDGNFEYSNDAVDSDLAYYQCDHCGSHIVYDNGLDIQNDEEVVEYIMSQNIINSYGDGACPDCSEDIPKDVKDGQGCTNCDHVFCLPIEGD